MSTAMGANLLTEHLRALHDLGTPWTHWVYPAKGRPELYVSSRRWTNCVDVVAVFLNPNDVTGLAYRAPMPHGDNPFRPKFVTWWYQGDPEWAIRAAITRPTPGTDSVCVEPPPPLCGVLANLLGDLYPGTVRGVLDVN